MAKVTREQLTRWNAKLNNGFELDLQQFLNRRGWRSLCPEKTGGKS